ncbi:hypothetical protein [Pseudaestuariivita sp.]|uniref:hypothetical protein n=1 Tax=Pseudaestuariivita sp. TaxID=2211669 RepID=UPI0040586C78
MVEARSPEIPEQLSGAELPAVLLPYQASLLETTAISPFTVCEKSRRIGMTWGVGADAVLTSGASRQAGGMDTLYIGFNLDMAREFIDVCAMWAKAFMSAAGAVEEFIFKDQTEDGAEKDINAFRISFASGYEIVALTSKPRSLRGRQGYVIFDEAAFHDELDEMLKAAMALLMWGGKVLVISTHDGVDNAFNRLILDIRAGKRDGKILKVTFDDAIADGLYERIAMVTGKPDTAEAKAQWIADIFGFYGDAADEELHCIPRAGSGAYLSAAAVEACMSDTHHVARLTCPDGFELRPIDERRAFVARFLEEEVAPHLGRLDPDRLTGLGEDFGRSSDLTVLAIGQERKDLSVVVPLIIELKNMPIEQQFQVIDFVVRGCKRFLGAKFDATGNGLGLAERAQEAFGYDRIEAVKLSQSYYLEHAPLLKRHFENQSIELPRDADIRDDMRVVKLVRGIPSIPDARHKGRHGDAFVALMLMIAALKTDYQPYAYRPVKKGGDTLARPVRTTAGFAAREGIW